MLAKFIELESLNRWPLLLKVRGNNRLDRIM